ncbi:hypothetical protein GCM10022271_00090 [Corallibacter vietnamensis]|uniref:Collagen-like protein n=1 Tax=Corallibacter vietnamensis TaxID=904130 RepID=A0ABP7GNS4_9FLAO
MKLTKTIKQTVKTTTYLMLAFVMAFTISCSPEDGRDGLPGEQGPAGEDGNANVVSSDWFQIQFDHTNGANDYGYMAIDIPNYQEFIDNGGVAMMYVRQTLLGDEYIIYQLPYEDIFSFALANVPSEGVENSLILFANQTDVSDLETEPGLTFRYILVPGNTTSKSQVNFEKMSYEDVINQLGLDY